MNRKNIIIAIGAFLMALGPFIIPLTDEKGERIAGTDDRAMQIITDANSDYKPWFEPLWKPEGESEKYYFGFQAAAGAAILGYCLIAFRNRRAKENIGKNDAD